jgi:hypothetical protein
MIRGTRARRGRKGEASAQIRTKRRLLLAVRWTALGLSILVVLGAQRYFGTSSHSSEVQAREAAAMLAELPTASPRHNDALPPGGSASLLRQAAPPLPAARKMLSRDGVELWRMPFRLSSAFRGRTPFERLDGRAAGFDRLPWPRPYWAMESGIMHLGALAAGDVNGDGWPDVVVGTHFGVFLYVNLGGQFALQKVAFPEMRNWIIGDVALIDLDGDGALDLFFSTWMHGSHILYNRNGTFSNASHTELPKTDENSVNSSGFADVDRDGDIDIVTGAAVYVPRSFYPANAVNRVWYNMEGRRGFRPAPLEGPEGETLTLLFVDLNRDHWPDLFVGNDYDEPDRVYLNRRGKLRPIKLGDNPIPRSTHDTMSADLGDLNNDGQDELYIGAIAMGDTGRRPALPVVAPLQSCEIFGDVRDQARCDAIARFQLAVIRSYSAGNLAPCKQLGTATEQRDCVVSAYHWHRVVVRLLAEGADPSEVARECEKVPSDFKSMRHICGSIRSSPFDGQDSDVRYKDELPSARDTNFLYTPGSDGFRDVTEAWRAKLGGWTWNARFGDLDNDGWQDLYISQGTRLRPNSVSSLYYRNKSGVRFEESAQARGLEDHNPTGASLFVDYDIDGDLDLITYPFLMAPVVWRNNAPTGPGLEIAVHDRSSANRDGVGARIEIRSPDGRIQVREVKASGGYLSHNPLVTSFGLGDWPSVAAIKVWWPDGDTQEVKRLRLKSGRYILVRPKR